VPEIAGNTPMADESLPYCNWLWNMTDMHYSMLRKISVGGVEI
jgi:hypothetical protein